MLEPEENLIVTVPVRDPDISLSSTMGQDEPVVPTDNPIEIKVQNLVEDQTEEAQEDLDFLPVPDSSLLKEEALCTGSLSEPSSDTNLIHSADPSTDLAPVSGPTSVSEPDLIPSSKPATSSASELPEEAPLDYPEEQQDALPSHGSPTQKTKTNKTKPSSLKIKDEVNQLPQTGEEQELPVFKATYNFDPDQLDNSFNPFTSGGSKIQNSPPPCGLSSLPRLEPLGSSLPVSEDDSTAQADSATIDSNSEAKPVVLEFGLEDGVVKKPPPKKLGGKRTSSKLVAKKQKAKEPETSFKPEPEPPSEPHPEPKLHPQSASDPVSDPVPTDSSAPLNLDDVPIPKAGTYNFEPSAWDDPNFNPFGSNNKMSSSPVLPKGSYSFDPEHFDDSVDPFKSSKPLNNEDSSCSVSKPETKLKKEGKPKARQTPGEKKTKQMLNKSIEKTTT